MAIQDILGPLSSWLELPRILVARLYSPKVYDLYRIITALGEMARKVLETVVLPEPFFHKNHDDY